MLFFGHELSAPVRDGVAAVVARVLAPCVGGAVGSRCRAEKTESSDVFCLVARWLESSVELEGKFSEKEAKTGG